MESNKIASEVEVLLKDLSKDGIARFAGICALRILPYLGMRGNFDYWGDKNRQTYLYAIFHAIDMNLETCVAVGAIAGRAADYRSAGMRVTPKSVAMATSLICSKASKEAYACGKAIAERGDAILFSDPASRFEVASKAAGFTSTCAAAACMSDAARDIHMVAQAAGSVYLATDIVFSALSYSLFKFIGLSNLKAKYSHLKATDLINMYTTCFHEILLQDIRYIRDDRPFPAVDMAMYGPVWINFREALEAEGCVYWWRLYEQLFSGSFIPDLKALKLRMRVPAPVGAKGAAAVAEWLERKEKQAASD
ncbi:MAG: hypothetical protein LBS05_00950 [Tannerellaceae bacterium]|nr:hypothetical protein [Tannerellaceae bacterium]